MPDTSNTAAYRLWRQTEEARNWLRTNRVYYISVNPDGTFRIEDISAGTYTLQIGVSIGDRMHLKNRRYGRVSRQIVVPDVPDGRSDTPLDLGKIIIQVGRDIAEEEVER